MSLNFEFLSLLIEPGDSDIDWLISADRAVVCIIMGVYNYKVEVSITHRNTSRTPLWDVRDVYLSTVLSLNKIISGIKKPEHTKPFFLPPISKHQPKSFWYTVVGPPLRFATDRLWAQKTRNFHSVWYNVNIEGSERLHKFFGRTGESFRLWHARTEAAICPKDVRTVVTAVVVGSFLETPGIDYCSNTRNLES